MIKKIDSSLYDNMRANRWSLKKTQLFIDYQKGLKWNTNWLFSVLAVATSILALVLAIKSPYFSMRFNLYTTLLALVGNKGTEIEATRLGKDLGIPTINEFYQLVGIVVGVLVILCILALTYGAIALRHNRKINIKINTAYKYLFDKLKNE